METPLEKKKFGGIVTHSFFLKYCFLYSGGSSFSNPLLAVFKNSLNQFKKSSQSNLFFVAL
jgi:hypothetical protein